MRYREHNGQRISEIGVGSYSLGGSYGPKDREEFKRMIRRAYDLGVTFFDTSDSYGDAEEVLGEAVRDFRDEVLLSTKIGARSSGRSDLSREGVSGACERSLSRLGTDRIDLYSVHFDDRGVPVQDVVDSVEGLASSGRIRMYGIGHVARDRALEYIRCGRVFSMLTELSPVALEAERDRLPICAENQVAAIAYSVTGRGVLTGRLGRSSRFHEDDIRRIDPLFQRSRFEFALGVADRLREIGEAHGLTPVQVSIAWVLSHPEVKCALTGPSTLAHLEENVAASGWSIPPDELDGLNRFLSESRARLEQSEVRHVREILHGPLDDDDAAAFKDLVYAVETSLSHGLAREQDVIDTFMALFSLRGKSGPDVRDRLAKSQAELRSAIPVNGPP